MSELELNQMHDWEDKCNEATMKQSEADAIKDYGNELVDNESEGWTAFYALADFIDSLVVEDEKPKNYAVPHSWLDPLLTGDKAVIGSPPYDCQDIERLLNTIRERTETDEEISLRMYNQWADETSHEETYPQHSFVHWLKERK